MRMIDATEYVHVCTCMYVEHNRYRSFSISLGVYIYIIHVAYMFFRSHAPIASSPDGGVMDY